MRVIRKSIEKEIVCPHCNSLLYYEDKDIRNVGDMEGNYDYCVICPECLKDIKVL